ncbi:Pheophytinase, chloroplastic-like protein [Drosera capensis]
MSLLLSPLHLRFLIAPCPPSATRRLSSAVSGAERRGGASAAAAIVWFKHDLRTDDHPGLVAAASEEFDVVVPVYVFDRRILSGFSDEMVDLIVLAVEDLRKSLKELGSNLMIRFGNAESVTQELVKEVKATHVFAELELEFKIEYLVNCVKETLAADTLIHWNVNFVEWQSPSLNVKDSEDMSLAYDDFKKTLPWFYGSPIPAPKFHGFVESFNWGELPTNSEVKQFKNEEPKCRKESWFSIKDTSADLVFQAEHIKMAGSADAKIQNQVQRKKPKGSLFGTNEGDIIVGGANIVIKALDAYFRHADNISEGDWVEVHKKILEAENRKGASFDSLFGPALQMGIISRRRVYNEAMKYKEEQYGGFLSPIRNSTATAITAFEAVCLIEWYRFLAIKSQASNGLYPIRLWSWKGYLIQYTVYGEEGPAVFLVHGFGAFLEHYRDNISSIADGGNQVWAITLLGFGRSEKPNIIYSELMWAELLRDFIVEVVGQPVHLIGNSFGGYLASIVGGLWPSLAKSIVLINSAGFVIPEYSSLLFSKERKIARAAWFGARALLGFLSFNLKSIVRSCYPTRTERADDWLVEEMLRASYDPGVIFVLESIFSLNLKIPLNFLLEKQKEKVLVIQGMKDPIDNSYLKVSMFKEYCPWVMIKELNAGHCPHDECPEEVNPIILEWISTMERRKHDCSPN